MSALDVRVSLTLLPEPRVGVPVASPADGFWRDWDILRTLYVGRGGPRLEDLGHLQLSALSRPALLYVVNESGGVAAVAFPSGQILRRCLCLPGSQQQ